MKRQRLDIRMVDNGLAESRTLAQRLIMAGEVRVDGELVLKSAALIPSTSMIEIIQKPPFVSRGGDKLAAALQAFDVDPLGKVCADVGASTGGFTDCLLQHGARLVYAIDVGKGILHWKLRNDKRIVVLEETNARYLVRLAQVVDLVTIDASFISLRILLPVIRNWFLKDEGSSIALEFAAGDVIALIKPQFEVGRKVAARSNGVIRDPAVHQDVLVDILTFAQAQGFVLKGLLRSPILGPKGNTEFLAWLQISPLKVAVADSVADAVKGAVAETVADEETLEQAIHALFP
jgi:23S rRNA (cytidine1920-2'-O)/16S rRNA (cytidine1409-2'-O)-methyltransferase